MKKVLLIISILVVAGGAAIYLLWPKETGIGRKKQPFIWGITMRPHSLGNYSKADWRAQVQTADELGVNTTRITWQHDAYLNKKLNPFGFHDEVFSELEKEKINIYLVVEDKDGELSKADDPYQNGYDTLYEIASHYKGKVKYYQLLNEAGSVALENGSFSGDKQEHYDAQKYEKVKEWLRGASAAVKKADPKAIRVISDQWVHYAFFEKLQADNVDYDYLGWGWFSDMWLIYENTLEDGTNIMDKLQALNKPILLSEINQRPEGDNGQDGMPEEKQAEFISKMADWAYNTGYIKGFIVLELVDMANPKSKFVDYYGLMEAQKASSGKVTLGKKREAFDIYKGIIAKYK